MLERVKDFVEHGGRVSAPGALTLSGGPTAQFEQFSRPVGSWRGRAHSSLVRGGGTFTFNANQRFSILNLGADTSTVYDNVISGPAADPGTESTWTIVSGGVTGNFPYDGAGGIDLSVRRRFPGGLCGG